MLKKIIITLFCVTTALRALQLDIEVVGSARGHGPDLDTITVGDAASLNSYIQGRLNRVPQLVTAHGTNASGPAARHVVRFVFVDRIFRPADFAKLHNGDHLDIH